MAEQTLVTIKQDSPVVEVGDGVRVWASLGTTINLGNFENYKIDIGVTGIPTNTSKEDLANRIKMSQMALYEVVMGLAEELGKRIADVKK